MISIAVYLAITDTNSVVNIHNLLSIYTARQIILLTLPINMDKGTSTRAIEIGKDGRTQAIEIVKCRNTKAIVIAEID